MHGPKISVIIPNYNYAHYLAEAIESVLNQSYKNIELIVVNNGSTDNSMQVIRKYLDKIILINQQNLGQAGARNSGSSLASGEYLGFLDADDFWDRDKIKKQMALLDNKTQLVYCGISKFSNSGKKPSMIISPRYRGECSQFFVENPGESIVLSGESTALFSKDLYLKVGKFDESLNSTSGWDFFRRCSKFTQFDFVNEPLTNYRIHKSNMSKGICKTIPDIRKAYDKFLNDELWNFSSSTRKGILSYMELSYAKTYLKQREWSHAIESLRNYRRMNSKLS